MVYYMDDVNFESFTNRFLVKSFTQKKGHYIESVIIPIEEWNKLRKHYEVNEANVKNEE